MRKDISLDPKATHYCKWCGLTMRPKEELLCSVCDGDFCEAVRRSTSAKAHDSEFEKAKALVK